MNYAHVRLIFSTFKRETVNHPGGGRSVYAIGIYPPNGQYERRYLIERTYP